MFKLFRKKKLKEDTLANIFINSTLEAIDNGFVEVVGIINESPEFLSSPQVSTKDKHKFTLIVFAANLKIISDEFDPNQDRRLINNIIEKLSKVYNIAAPKMEQSIKDYQRYLSSVNHPSKNTLYAMSKAMFYKYELGQFQEVYFKKLNAPNPLFLKRIDEIMKMFLFDWNALKEDFQIIHD